MIPPYDRTRQFHLTPKEFLLKLDLLNWYRYHAIVKKLSELEPRAVLEIGPGEGTVKRVYEPFAERYETMDVNEKLSPTYVGEAQAPRQELSGRYDAVVAADILEHIPFADLGNALRNIFGYLKPGGHALITIPHRSQYFLWMTSLDHAPRILRIPTLKWFLRWLGAKVSIDPDHQWEIGDGRYSIRDVETTMRKAGFAVADRQKLLYVDFWTLKK